VRLETKDKWYWRALAVLAAIFTFGGMSRRDFLEHYGTTIGPIQGYPRELAQLQNQLLVHEARHTRQCRFLGFGWSPWLGLPLFVIIYFLLPLPLIFAYGRYWLELDADATEWQWMLGHEFSPNQIRQDALRRGQSVKGGNYGWAWPWAVRGYQNKAEKVITNFICQKYAKEIGNADL
jgi:hypothetical protein